MRAVGEDAVETKIDILNSANGSKRSVSRLFARTCGCDAVFREGLFKAVNLGDDADTTEVICGQFAGAYYGEDAIVTSW
jgi:ADP-ribosylglycohydrolase